MQDEFKTIFTAFLLNKLGMPTIFPDSNTETSPQRLARDKEAILKFVDSITGLLFSELEEVDTDKFINEIEGMIKEKYKLFFQNPETGKRFYATRALDNQKTELTELTRLFISGPAPIAKPLKTPQDVADFRGEKITYTRRALRIKKNQFYPEPPKVPEITPVTPKPVTAKKVPVKETSALFPDEKRLTKEQKKAWDDKHGYLLENNFYLTTSTFEKKGGELDKERINDLESNLPDYLKEW